MRNSSFEKISSLPGMVASALTSSTFSSLPSTMPSLNWNSAFSPTHLAKHLGQRHRIARGERHRAHALQALQRAFDLGALARNRRQLVLHHAILAARLADHLAQLKILRHGQLG